MDKGTAQGQFLGGGLVGVSHGTRGELPDATVKLLTDLIDAGASQLKDGRAHQQDDWSQVMVASSRILAFHNSMREQREMQEKYAAEFGEADRQAELMSQTIRRN